jgi:hypothetical protein
MFQTKVVEKIKTHILCSITFFSNIVPFLDNVEKYRKVGQATGGNMAHAHCMLDNKGYKYTLTICNTYCFSTATKVARTRPNVSFQRTLPVFSNALLRSSFAPIKSV